MTLESDKSALRKDILSRLKSQSPTQRSEKSRLIIQKLKQTVVFQKAAAVMFYVPLESEVDIFSLLEEVLAEKIVTVPYIDRQSDEMFAVKIDNPKTDLAPGSYRVLEPKPQLAKPYPKDRLDLVLVPGIAFDHAGGRLGRGKGYYDRFLQTLPKQVRRIGLAFDFQMVDSVPVCKTDAKVDQVITN